jgi:alpha-amylase
MIELVKSMISLPDLFRHPPILLTKIFLFVSIFLLLTTCRPREGRGLWPHGVKYEIFVLAFADSNNDGKGDLNGVTKKLDYLEELGINGIWLMPIMPSPSYHKYDVSDYKSIHPEYGTLEDFKELVKEAHSRDIKVVIDLVLNHTSLNHPWFKRAQNVSDSTYRDYYIWNDRQSIRDQIAKKTTTLDSDNITQWHTVNGDTTQEHYYGFFSSHMPDLNFDNAKVRAEFVDIAKFWIEEMNVDGFRFDAAKHIYPDDRAWDSHQFWKWYRAELEKIKPDVYLVGEVYSLNSGEVGPYTKGLPSLFNFRLGRSIINSLSTGKDVGLIYEYQRQLDSYRLIAPEFLDAPILSNHDQNRIASELGGNVSKLKVAATILLTLPGAPFMYYGEELGMLGMKPDENIREPFLWGDKEIESRWMEPKYNLPDTIASLDTQEDDEHSLFSHYKTLLYYRNTRLVMTFGEIKPINRLPHEVIGYVRSHEDKSALVFHNVSDRDVSFTLEEDLIFYSEIDFQSSDKIKLDGYVVILPALSSIILKKKG